MQGGRIPLAPSFNINLGFRGHQRRLQLGGYANNGANAGPWYGNWNNAASNGNWNISAVPLFGLNVSPREPLHLEKIVPPENRKGSGLVG